LKCDHPTLFRNDELVQGLKDGTLDMKKVAADSASGNSSINKSTRNNNNTNSNIGDCSSNGNDISSNIETWSVLAINKFDSTRKRMSILVRSPEEFGNVAILLCKGADSAMLDPEICTTTSINDNDNDDDDDANQQQNQNESSEWEVAKMLGIESHLGEFASEGLRTLVLGVRFLTDKQCDEWLSSYASAAASIKDRDTKLKQCASEIEKELHIVGATAIEDKLQQNVPKTIATLAKAGIKLWVLTGDKRETAIEIGYATQVLTPQMHLTEVSDRGLEFVRAQCAMEFMRLVKAGKLPAYQRAVIDQPDQKNWLKNVIFSIGKVISVFFRILKRVMLQFNITLRGVFGFKRMIQQQRLENLNEETSSKKETPNDLIRRRNVRNRAEEIVKRYAELHPVINKNEPELSTDNLPPVFNRAQSAKETLDMHRSQGKMTSIDERESRLSQLTVQNVIEKQKQLHTDTSGDGSKPTIDDDMLSLQSFYPSKKDKLTSDFDKKKRTPLERMFAVDRDVRKGRLVKHLKMEKRVLASSSPTTPHTIVPSGDGPRALIIEGNALKHLQGDSELEELIFNIASQCSAVIACRVTPVQKAQLVKLVRHHVVPEPVTLAIGDGANDVGMIHEAHVGIGISGKEGKQAVNASDFSIGQFRFLEDLILYHGRWDYMRTSMVVLYSFYKNFVIAGCLVLYNHETLFSGTSLFDQWLNSGFSFFAFFPILFLGMFDRNLEKSYIRKNPEVYKPTRQKELITARILSRWIFMAIAHIAIIYYGQMQQLSGGGGSTSAFRGLMWNNGTVGDGQNSDWQSMG
jgi:magnesium-transporting ATPase (P-type)